MVILLGAYTAVPAELKIYVFSKEKTMLQTFHRQTRY